MTTLKRILHPEFEHLWLGTYQESHKVRLDILYRLGLPRIVDQSQTPAVQLHDPYGLGCDWGIVKIGFPTLLGQGRPNYRFTKEHLPHGRAWIPDWLEFAVPRQEFGLGALPESGCACSDESDGKNQSWVPGPKRVQSRRMSHAETTETASALRLQWPQYESLLAGHMERNCRKTASTGAKALDWPSREADYFDGHAAYEPALPQAAKSFLRHLAKTFTQANTHDPVRGVHTLQQMCDAAYNAARRQEVGRTKPQVGRKKKAGADPLADAINAAEGEELKKYPLIETIIHMNLMYAVEKVAYGHLNFDVREHTREKFEKLGIGEESVQPEPEAGGSEADGGRRPPPTETGLQIWQTLSQLLLSTRYY